MFMRSQCVFVYMCAPFQLLKHVTDFYETWYEHHAIGGHSNSYKLISYNQKHGVRTNL
jgi:hypothetical protein